MVSRSVSLDTLFPPSLSKWLSLGVIVFLASGCRGLGRQTSAEVLAARQMALRGVAAWEQGEADQAEQLFQNALENCPAEERAHRYYAELLWKRGDRRLALIHMERAAELSDGATDVLVRVGQMRAEQGELAEALKWADRSIAQNDLDPSAWALRSDVLFAQGRLSEALVSCHRALNQQRDNLPVELRTVMIYRRMSRPRRALSTLDAIAARYLPHQIPVEVLEEQSGALVALGRLTAAEQKLAQAALREPTPDRLCRLCDLQRLSGRRDEAMVTITNVLAEHPNHPGALSLHQQLSRRVVQAGAQTAQMEQMEQMERRELAPELPVLSR